MWGSAVMVACDVHHVPGRIRFKIPGLCRDDALMRALPRALRRYDGVETVEVWPASNSLIVRYDPQRIDPGRIARAVNRGQFAKAANERAGGTAPKGKPNGLRGHGAWADDIVLTTVRQMGVVFGRTAFKTALDQALRGGVSSLVRAAIGRG